MSDEFLRNLSVAFGRPGGTPTEEEVIREIYRLREAAGELERNLLATDLENMVVADVMRVPGAESLHLVSLLIRTRAQVVEGQSQFLGGPWRDELYELPQRLLNLMLEETEARTVHRLLTEQIAEWDASG